MFIENDSYWWKFILYIGIQHVNKYKHLKLLVIFTLIIRDEVYNICVTIKIWSIIGFLILIYFYLN